jgi:DNA-binding CsgD family transcriptional regulator
MRVKTARRDDGAMTNRPGQDHAGIIPGGEVIVNEREPARIRLHRAAQKAISCITREPGGEPCTGAGMSGELWLVIRRESIFERIHHVVADETYLGRLNSHPICLADRAVSRNHAVIRNTPDGFLLQDLRSKNGILVNGLLVQRQFLSAAMEFRIGPFRLQAFDNRKEAEKNSEIPDDETKSSPEAPCRYAMLQSQLQKLTDAQRRVYDCLLDGDSEKEVASRLHISIHTVHSHTKAIYKAFNVTTRAELLAHCTTPPTIYETL